MYFVKFVFVLILVNIVFYVLLIKFLKMFWINCYWGFFFVFFVYGILIIGIYFKNWCIYVFMGV